MDMELTQPRAHNLALHPRTNNGRSDAVIHNNPSIWPPLSLFSPLTLARGAVVIAHPVAGLAAALVAYLQVDTPLLAAAVVQRALVDAALPLGEHT